jgi:hypothetical protein
MAKVESRQSWMNDCRFSGTLNDDVLKQMDEEASGNEDVRFYAKLS